MRTLFSFFIVLGAWAALPENKDGIFEGKLDHINEKVQLVRIHTTAPSVKYLAKGDRVYVGDHSGVTECRGDVVARSREHVLLKLLNFKFCSRNLSIARGVWLKFYGQSLAEKVAKGQKLVQVLLKKRLAVLSQLGEEKKDLRRQNEKIDIANRKYGVLRDKVAMEWKEALTRLEGERSGMLKKREEFERRLVEINKQLERYRVEGQVWEWDRWSLDQRFYFKK